MNVMMKSEALNKAFDELYGKLKAPSCFARKKDAEDIVSFDHNEPRYVMVDPFLWPEHPNP